ncbi:MAG: hypothetical protein J7K40_07815 [candidate division Zixibacteria bacterium]|nr:hypothetical protein [candidate division Zixibacteria bacterium]
MNIINKKEPPIYNLKPVFCFTSDMDWASEAALTNLQEIFDLYDIHATYFATHESSLINKWYKEKKIDVGIHPNFLPESSHGNSFKKVIDTVMKFAPQARCFRSHRCFDATPVTHALAERGILYDSNMITNLQQGIMPIKHESGLIRFPVFYEDGTHFEWRRSWDFGKYAELFGYPGIKIISIHAMITALNVTTSEYWAQLKVKFPPDRWINMSKNEITENICVNPGPRQFLKDMIEYIKTNNHAIMTMEELYQYYIDNEA